MTRLSLKPLVAGILVIFGLFFASWLVTQATAADLKEGPGMDVPQKGTTNDYWAEWFGPHPYIKEPAPKFISRWEINEVPRNVTVYYDVNGDGFHDIVFAHPIVAENHVVILVQSKNIIGCLQLVLSHEPQIILLYMNIQCLEF